MHDLREAVDGLVETVVVPVDEDENPSALGLGEKRVQTCGRHRQAERIGFRRDEVACGIGRQPSRPLHVPDLALRVRRQRNRDIGEGKAVRTFAREHLAGLGALGAAGRGDEKLDLARPRRRRLCRNEDVAHRSAAPGKQRPGDEKDQGLNYKAIDRNAPRLPDRLRHARAASTSFLASSPPKKLPILAPHP